jgi:hypothetical protein
MAVGSRPIPDLATVPPLKMIFLLGFPLAAIGSTEPIFPAGLAPVQRQRTWVMTIALHLKGRFQE